MLMLGRKPVSPLCMPYAGIEKATNCVLEIPHTFTIEQSGNTFTLKSGSTVALVNRNTYTTTTTTQDFSATVNNDGLHFLVYSGWNFVSWMTPISLGSGTSLPADNSQYNYFFLINNNTGSYYLWKPETSTWEGWGGNGSYPLAVVEVKNGVASFAKDSNGNDMIFNGAGFIGHHAFVYPNVKVLIPDGLNTDGSLKSIEYTLNSLNIEEITSDYPNIFIKDFGSSNTLRVRGYHIVNTYDEINIQSFHHYYVKSENKMYRAMSSTTLSEYGSVNIVNIGFNGTTVTDFAIQQPLTKYRWVVKLIP